MKEPTLRTISAEDLEHLQIDDKRQLYWNGGRIRNQITLTWFQTFVAIVAVVAEVATIANGAASGLNNAATFVRARGVDVSVCRVLDPADAAADGEHGAGATAALIWGAGVATTSSRGASGGVTIQGGEDRLGALDCRVAALLAVTEGAGVSRGS